MKDKTPLSGERESFVTLDQSLQANPKLLHQPVTVPPAITNTSWAQAGGNPSHSMPPLTLPGKLEKAWRVGIGSGSYDGLRLLSNIVVDHGVAYGMDSTGVISAVDTQKGEVIWKQETKPEDSNSDALGGGVVFGGGVLYASTSFGEVISLDPKTGKVLWQTKIACPIRVAPTVKDGRVFVVTINNETYALDAKTGSHLWMHAGITEQAALLGGANPAVVDHMVIVAYSSGEIYALQVENGHVLWTDTLTSALRIDTVSSIPHIKARPVVDGGQVFTISHGGRMTAIDIKTGARQWQVEIGGVRTPAVAGNWLFVLTSQGDVVCLDRHTGEIRWASASLPKLAESDKTAISWAGPVVVNADLAFSGSNGEVMFLNSADGKVTKTLTFEGAGLFSPIVVDKTLYILTDQADLHAWK
ncbi:MAG: PQQ-binding-like beta-propeller repeat protein [Alphaproteobacteria bacterium]|nr:PQQ-binding-like beta-propeller repeat protein [Alphaproteobacteria bacterium]